MENSVTKDNSLKNKEKIKKRVMISFNDNTLKLMEQISERYSISKSSLINILVEKYARSEYGIKDGKKA